MIVWASGIEYFSLNGGEVSVWIGDECEARKVG